MSDKQVTRRNFMKAVGLAGAGSIAGARAVQAQNPTGPAASAAPLKPDPASMPLRAFGKTGAKVSILGLGGIFDIASNQLVLKQALDWGVTYWDTAEVYNGGRSELGIGMYLEKNPQVRKSIFLVTKGHSRDSKGLTEGLAQSLERMKTDYIDLYFVHGVNNTAELTDETKAWVEKAKADKKIRFFGFSTHGNMENCLAGAAKLGWIDGIMLKYDFRLMPTDAMRAAVDACAAAGVGLTAMKTQGARSGASGSAEFKLGEHFLQRGFTEAQAKVKAVWENPNIACVCSQMPSTTVLMSNIAAACDKTKLTAADHDALREYAAATCSGVCAGCTQFCETALREPAPIGEVMRSLMYHHQYGDHRLAREVFAGFSAAQRQRLAASDFLAAERVCPNRLPITAMVREAMGAFA